MDHLHISATGHSLNYLPHYLARELGFFTEQRLNVTEDVPNPWTRVLDEINTGRAFAALGGIWVPSMLYKRVRNYRAFAQLSSRCPMVLLSREPVAQFALHDLKGRLVVVSGTGGLGGYAFLTGLLQENGIAVSAVRFMRDLDYDFLLELFRGGLGDFLIADIATAHDLIAEGKAYMASDLGAEAGPVPWSVFYTPAEAFEANKSVYQRFASALRKSFAYIQSHPLAELSGVTAKIWPDHDSAQLTQWLEHLKRIGMWSSAGTIDRAAYDRWQSMLVRSSLIEAPVTYDRIVGEA